MFSRCACRALRNRRDDVRHVIPMMPTWQPSQSAAAGQHAPPLLRLRFVARGPLAHGRFAAAATADAVSEGSVLVRLRLVDRNREIFVGRDGAARLSLRVHDRIPSVARSRFAPYQPDPMASLRTASTPENRGRRG
jgi:hypothetical protein